MSKKFLSSHGNTWQLYINKPIAKLLGITSEEYTVLLTTENKTLQIKKISNIDIEKYKDLLYKKLIKRSGSYGLNLPVPILEMLEIDPEKDMVDYEVNGLVMTIKKAD